jgi:GT2 family glycosyltransferase
MIDLHLVSWNRPKMTELVIKTIHRNTPREDFNLTVIDNGSNTSVKNMLFAMKRKKLIDTLVLWDENNGLEGARQFALNNYANNEFFVDIDNDCLPPNGWLYNQVNLMEKYEDMAAIAQRTPVMIGTGNIFETTDTVGMDITDFPHPGGSFRMMRTSAVEQVGGWDRESSGRGSEERYICGKLRSAGYGTAFATNIISLHLFGDRAKTKERWGYQEGMQPEETGHSDIWHPALEKGDSFTDVVHYSGEDLAKEYFS